MSIKPKPTPKIVISLDDFECELLNNYLSYCNENLGLNVTVKDFLIDNVLFWNDEAFGTPIPEFENDPDNILSDEFITKLKSIEKDIKANNLLTISITLDKEYWSKLITLQRLIESELGNKVSLEWVIQKCIDFSYGSIIEGGLVNEY